MEANEAVQRILRAHWKLITVAVILGLGAALFITRGETTMYAGTARVALQHAPPCQGGACWIGASPAEGRGRGGAVVVLGGRESRPRGEGRQRVKQGEVCNVRRHAGESRRRLLAGS